MIRDETAGRILRELARKGAIPFDPGNPREAKDMKNVNVMTGGDELSIIVGRGQLETVHDALSGALKGKGADGALLMARDIVINLLKGPTPAEMDEMRDHRGMCLKLVTELHYHDEADDIVRAAERLFAYVWSGTVPAIPEREQLVKGAENPGVAAPPGYRIWSQDRTADDGVRADTRHHLGDAPMMSGVRAYEDQRTDTRSREDDWIRDVGMRAEVIMRGADRRFASALRTALIESGMKIVPA